MAATLPPINTKGQNMGMPGRNVFMPTPPRGPPSGRLQPIKVPGKADREILLKHGSNLSRLLVILFPSITHK